MIEIRNIVKNFDGFTALRGISFAVNDGEIHGFIGPNGSGKTTTMRILSTLLDQTSGDAIVDGHCVVGAPDRVRRIIGYMPDNYGIYDRISVEEYIDFFAACYGMTYRERRPAVEGVMDLLDLTDLRDRPAAALSKGMRKRLILAKSIVHNPRVLILDEPAEGLDPRARIEFRAFLKELREMGKTILISSHILTELADVCDAITIIERGALIASGTIADILARIKPRRTYAIGVLGGTDVALTALAGVGNVAEARAENGRITFQYGGEPDGIAEIVALLVRNDVRIVAVEETKTNLEGLFMELTKGEVQ